MKVLEYELKLLKDREVEERQKLSSMDKFFSDGIPINNNILALKSMFKESQEQGNNLNNNLSNEISQIESEINSKQVQTDQNKQEIEQMEEDFKMMEK